MSDDRTHRRAPASEIIHVRVTPAQRLELRRVARQNGILISDVIREAVDEYCLDCRDSGIFRDTRRLGRRTISE